MLRSLSAALGVLVVGALMNSAPALSASAQTGPQATNARIFDAVRSGIESNYYGDDAAGLVWLQTGQALRPDAIAAADEESLYRVINVMLRRLDDRHTLALSPSYVARDTQQGLTNLPLGLGMNVAPMADAWHVTDVTPGGPGEAAGLTIGTAIVEADGEPFDGFFRPQQGKAIVLLVRSPEGVLRSAEVAPRPAVPWRSRKVQILDGEVLYLSLLSFDPGTADWIKARLDEHSGATGLIVDLRGNAGGSLSEAVQTTSLFMGRAYDAGSMKSRVQRHNRGCDLPIARRNAGQAYGGPMVVLIDRYSFSSAEIVAALLQQHGRAVIVGENSGASVTCMGKLPLPDGGMLRFSAAAYTAPNGDVLNEVGVTPDLVVAGSPDQRRAGPDLALAEAERLIRSQSPSP